VVFNQQMRHLAKHYNVVSMERVVEAVQKGCPLPRHAVLLTFDDAYRDFGEVAWPILKRYRLPVTLFVPTAYPDQPERRFWWDRLYQAITCTTRIALASTQLGQIPLGTPAERKACLLKLQNYIKRVPHGEAMALVDRVCDELGNGRADSVSVLSWDELKKLAKEGVTLGAHTRTHPILTQLSPEQAREEIHGSQQDLRRELKNALPIFCYPHGAHNDTVVNLLREEGFEVALTTLRGQNKLSATDPLRLKRTNIGRGTSLPIFRLRLMRLVSYVDRWRQPKQEWATSS
jgi:peptidoglycan/xylan/chitin deacetylase (PgdA/CDA1 family)